MRNKIAKLEQRLASIEAKLDLLTGNFEERLGAKIDEVIAQYDAVELQRRSDELKLALVLERELKGEGS